MLAADFEDIPFSLTIHGPSVFYAPVRWSLGEKLARAEFTACISHFCRSQCLIFAPEKSWPKLHIVRCSIQPIFAEEPLARGTGNAPQFICIGRLSVEKGQRLILEAIRFVKESVPSVQVSLVGDGPDRGNLEQKIREWSLQENVKILGWQSSLEIRNILSRSTALLIPSMAEGLPVVAMEALAARCPVIATNIAAMSELVDPQRSGWLMPSGSVEHLAAAIKQAAQLPAEDLYARGEYGRKFVLEHHHPHVEAQKLLRLFQSTYDRPQN
jgi:glycosyltransferase involved in cell wall biosynthesis